MTMPDTPTVTPPVDGLLPCPFCGSLPELREGHDHWRVECLKCGVRRAQLANGGVEEDRARAVRCWNKRVPIAALRPMEADDAGLIEMIDALRDRRKVSQETEDRAADTLASLSAAKVEAEKEVERLRGQNTVLIRKLREFGCEPIEDVDAHLAALKGRAQSLDAGRGSGVQDDG